MAAAKHSRAAHERQERRKVIKERLDLRDEHLVLLIISVGISEVRPQLRLVSWHEDFADVAANKCVVIFLWANLDRVKKCDHRILDGPLGLHSLLELFYFVLLLYEIRLHVRKLFVDLFFACGGSVKRGVHELVLVSLLLREAKTLSVRLSLGRHDRAKGNEALGLFCNYTCRH